MPGGSKRGGGDRILESRHLVGLFLGVVLLCGVFFTLGYVMGRTQYGGSVHAETIGRRPAAEPAASAGPSDATDSSSATPNEWDFYNNNKKSDAKADPAVAQTTDQIPASAAEEQDKPAPALTPVKAPLPAPAPKTAKGSIVLQIAALRHESDALAMAGLLQQKHFPSFVADPANGDALYRVQVGPYATDQAADAAKAALDHAGFKAIIKR